MVRTLKIDTIHSPDDGGYYAEVSDEQGCDMHVTDVYPTQEQAKQKAIRHCSHLADLPNWKHGRDW